MEFNAWHPWVFVSHMFLHEGFWHLLWNMLFIYWFGRIVGDLLGDQRIWPLYLLGGLAGAIGYLLSALILKQPGIALGASGAVMAMVMAAATTAPDYEMRLILIGNVKLKYIAAVLLLLDIFALGGMNNTGGHFAHVGGAVFGWYFVFCLRRGLDFSSYINQLGDGFNQLFVGKKTAARPTLVKVPGGLSKQFSNKSNKEKEEEYDLEAKIDAILDKIRQSGFDSLTAEEKETLYKASKEK
jgi:membrane associated rhomboid family serine protease